MKRHTPDEWMEAVGISRAELRWADGSVRAAGRLLAYSIAPQVLIETTAGERIWCRSDMALITDMDA